MQGQLAKLKKINKKIKKIAQKYKMGLIRHLKTIIKK